MLLSDQSSPGFFIFKSASKSAKKTSAYTILFKLDLQFTFGTILKFIKKSKTKTPTIIVFKFVDLSPIQIYI